MSTATKQEPATSKQEPTMAVLADYYGQGWNAGYQAAIDKFNKQEPAVPPADVLKFARAMKANEYRGSLFFAKTIIDWVADHAAKPLAPTPKEPT